MMTDRKLVGWTCLTLVLVACGSDAKKNAACPDGVKAGAEVTCSCDDAGKTGKQICMNDNSLGDCSCSGTLTDGGVMSPSDGSGGTNASGGSGGKPATGTGGSGSISKDGGMTTPPTDGGSVGGDDGPVVPLPKDGDQLAVCASGVDCNMGLDCYNTAGPSQGFCTKVCATDDDCKGVSGGAYTCQLPQGVCAIKCTGTDDTNCPAQMACQQIGGGGGFGTGGFGGPPFGTGGFGGGTGGVGAPAPAANFQCTYPEGAGIVKAAAWEPCMSMTSADCKTGAVCSGIGANQGGSGYCSPTCMTNDDCTAKPASGAIMPTCVSATGSFGGAPQMRCVLDCASNSDGCPTGMSCVTPMTGGGMGPGMGMGMGFSRCEFD